MFILDDILMSPINGLMWLAKKVEDLSDQDLSDKGKIKEMMMELQMRFELDEITEDEFNQRQDDLLHRLNSIE